MKENYTVSTPDDFQELIADLFLETNSKDKAVVIALQGDLGAGKTTFTQQLAKALGVTETVTSPTFIIMKQYGLDHERFDQLVHIDAYRLEEDDEVAPLRLAEIFRQPRTIVCLEWPEQIPKAIPGDVIRVSININPDQSRQVTISVPNDKLNE